MRRPICIRELRDDVVKYIKELEQELDSAKISYEQMHKIYRGAEDECDQLKVEVEALKPYQDNHHNLMRHMAEHDAQVIRDFCSFALKKYRYDLSGFADEFNQSILKNI